MSLLSGLARNGVRVVEDLAPATARGAENLIPNAARGGEVAADLTRASETTRAVEGASNAAHAGAAATTHAPSIVVHAPNTGGALGKLADAAKYPAGVLATAFAGDMAYRRVMSGLDRGERMVKAGAGFLGGEMEQLALALEHQWDKIPGAANTIREITGSPVLGGIVTVLTVGVVVYVAYETYEYIF